MKNGEYERAKELREAEISLDASDRASASDLSRRIAIIQQTMMKVRSAWTALNGRKDCSWFKIRTSNGVDSY
jgi:flagellar biosynthesis/type III secretory pathway chaperone